MISEIEPCEKEGIFTPERFCLILFNATMTSVIAIPDANYRHNAKRRLSDFKNAGNLFWKQIKFDSKQNDAMTTYEELSGYLFHVAKIALEQSDYNKFLKHIEQCK